MKVIAKFEETDSMEVTITITQTLDAWRTLAAVISDSHSSPGKPYSLLRAISTVTESAKKTITAEIDPDE